MAISVKTFINPLNCEEPAYEVPVLYHQTSATEICDGNGTTTNIYGDFANLSEIASNSGTGNAANSDICQDGMDVVFVVDYTGSMSNAISGVKSGINSIVNEIQSQSNGNYRLGLVLFDGPNPSYVNQSDFYADLDSTQKINSGSKVITCVEKMNLVGNQSTFATHLSYIDQTNGPQGMALGSSVECGGTASYEVIQNSFGGQWRANVLKLIILITDDEPTESSTYFNNTLIPAADTNNVQVFSNIAQYTGSGSTTVNTSLYSALSNNTTPAGQAYTGLDFTNSTWVNNMISGITTLCAETTTYTCDPAPAGWYTDSPLAGGATIHYWDGSAWTQSHDCQFTVTVDIIDNITNGSVNDILLTHPNQLDLDTFTFTGIPGSVHTATIGCTADSGYTSLSVNVSNVSDTNVVTNTSINNINDEVTITVTIPNQDEAESIQINGSASQIQRTVRVDVINNTNDNTNVVGGGQTPIGQVAIEEETPSTGWTSVYSSYLEDAKRYTFTGVSGDTHAIDVNFLPNPSDYSINVTSVTLGYTELGGNTSSAATALGQTAIANLTLSGSAPFDYTGNLQIPNGDVWIKVYVNADVNQPLYRYTLHASDSITGATVSPAQQYFEGYTGAQFPFTATANADSGYNNVNVASVGLDLTYNENAAITTGPTVNNGNTGVFGTVTIPSGGGQGGFILNGSASAITYSYVITIDDSAFSGLANWTTPVTLLGVAGSTPSVVVNSQNMNGNYSYNLTGVSSNQSILTPSISNATSMAILLDLDGGMPVGGGSATVTLTGSATAIIYQYELDIVASSPVLGQWPVNPIILSGPAGQNFTGSFNFNEVANNTYSATGVSSNTITASGTLGTGSADLFDVDYSVTMPTGGGNGTLTVTNASSTLTQYSYTVIYDSSYLSGGNNHTATPSSQVLTGSANSVISFAIDLDPSPSYYVIDITNVNQITTHDGSGGSATELAIIGYNSSNNKITGELTMPANGGTGYVRPKGTSTNPSVNFTVNAAEFITNATLNSPNIATFSGTAGSGPYTHTYTVTPSSGYTVNITSALVGSSYSGALTSSINNTASGAETVDITLSSMPVGGGSSTLSISGYASQQNYFANMVWDEDPNIAGAGAWDTTNNNFSGVAGDQFSIDNTWRIQNNTTFYSASNTAVSTTGTNYPSSNPFSSLIIQNPTSGTSSRTRGTFTMPIGGGTWNFSINGSTQTTLPTYNCTDFNTSFNLTTGPVGSSIMNYVSWDGSPMGMIPFGLNLSFDVSTFQANAFIHTATFTVPSGYSNSGNSFQCTFGATGTTTTTTSSTTTLPVFDCKDVLIGINSGAVGDALSYSNGNRTAPAVTVNSISPSTYQLGTASYTFNIQVPFGYSNTGLTINCTFYGTGTTTTTTTTTTSLPSFSCADTNLTIPNGAVGQSVLVNTNGIGTALSTNPSTYTLGTNQYVVTVRVPSGYSNAFSNITCDVFGTGTTTTTTTTAAPSNCASCDGNMNSSGAGEGLFLQPDYQPETGVSNGWLALWAPSDACTFQASTIKLYKSTTATGTYADIGTPSIWTYSESSTSGSLLVPSTSTISNTGYAQYIGNLSEGYYYIEGRDQYGCLQQSKSIWLANSNQVSNDWSYLYGVPCAANATNGSTSSTDRAQIYMKLTGSNPANQFSFQQGNFTPSSIYNYTMEDILRVKIDNSITDAGMSSETNIPYILMGDVVNSNSSSYNSDLTTKIKFSGYTVLPRPYNIGGNNPNAVGDHQGNKISNMRGAAWGSNNKYMNQAGQRRSSDSNYAPEGISTVNPTAVHGGPQLFAGVGNQTTCTSITTAPSRSPKGGGGGDPEELTPEGEAGIE